jgi:hypothetical protein
MTNTTLMLFLPLKVESPRSITSLNMNLILLSHHLANLAHMDSHIMLCQLHQMHLHIIMNPPPLTQSISHLQSPPPFTYLVHKLTNGAPPFINYIPLLAPYVTKPYFTGAPISVCVLSTK